MAARSLPESLTSCVGCCTRESCSGPALVAEKHQEAQVGRWNCSTVLAAVKFTEVSLLGPCVVESRACRSQRPSISDLLLTKGTCHPVFSSDWKTDSATAIDAIPTGTATTVVRALRHLCHVLLPPTPYGGLQSVQLGKADSAVLVETTAAGATSAVRRKPICKIVRRQSTREYCGDRAQEHVQATTPETGRRTAKFRLRGAIAPRARSGDHA